MFVGPVAHKRVLLKIRADIVRFVTQPFGLHAFIEAIESCLVSTAQWARHVPAQLPEQDMSHAGDVKWLNVS